MDTKTLTKNLCTTSIAHPQVPIKEHHVKKFVRRMKELVKPTHCRIRYDTMTNKWAVLKDDNSAHHHFDYGVMTNVVFSTKQVSGYDNLRCSSTTTIGIAEGDLRENHYGNDGVGFSHMEFDHSKGFVD